MMAYQALSIDLEVVVVKVYGCQIDNKDEVVTRGDGNSIDHHLVNEWVWGR